MITEVELDAPPASQENPYSGSTQTGDLRFQFDTSEGFDGSSEVTVETSQGVRFVFAQSGRTQVKVLVRQSTGRSTDPPKPQHASILDRIYSLVKSNQHRQAAADVMEYLDKLLLSRDFEACKVALYRVDVDKLKDFPTVLVAFLGITVAAKEHLDPIRDALFGRVKAALSETLGSGRANLILDRFR